MGSESGDIFSPIYWIFPYSHISHAIQFHHSLSKILFSEKWEILRSPNFFSFFLLQSMGAYNMEGMGTADEPIDLDESPTKWNIHHLTSWYCLNQNQHTHRHTDGMNESPTKGSHVRLLSLAFVYKLIYLGALPMVKIYNYVSLKIICCVLWNIKMNLWNVERMETTANL